MLFYYLLCVYILFEYVSSVCVERTVCTAELKRRGSSGIRCFFTSLGILYSSKRWLYWRPHDWWDYVELSCYLCVWPITLWLYPLSVLFLALLFSHNCLLQLMRVFKTHHTDGLICGCGLHVLYFYGSRHSFLISQLWCIDIIVVCFYNHWFCKLNGLFSFGSLQFLFFFSCGFIIVWFWLLHFSLRLHITYLKFLQVISYISPILALDVLVARLDVRGVYGMFLLASQFYQKVVNFFSIGL